MGQSELMRLVVRTFESLDIPYMITGSHASAYYGEPRFTRDIDIVAEIQEGQVDAFVSFFPPNEYYCDKDIIKTEIKRHGQFNIIHTASGLKVDVILRKETPFSRMEFSRRKRSKVFSDQEANFVAPEDVIIKKMAFYKEGGSEKHLRDITGILKISGDAVDRNYISEWAKRLELTDIWDAVQKRLNEKP